MNLPPVHVLDAILLVIIGFTLVRGAFRGLIREAMGIVAVGGAYVLANLTYESLEPGLEALIESPQATAATAYAITFVAFAVTLALVVHFLDRELSRMLPMNAVNQAGGLVLGALKGVLVASILVFVMKATPDGEPVTQRSFMAPLVMPVAEALGHGFLEALPKAPPPPVVPLIPE
jgi:membrane protein required for colicin V production